jgi:hypothetical protein
MYSVDDRMINVYGAVGGTRIGRRNRNTRRKLAPVPLCPPQIAHDLTLGRTQATAVGSRRIGVIMLISIILIKMREL